MIAAVLVEATVLWGAHLLGNTPTFLPWLPAVLVVTGTLAAAALVAAGRWRKAAAVALLAGVLAGAAGSGAYAVSTASQAHTGSTPSSGPVAVGGMARGPAWHSPAADRQQQRHEPTGATARPRRRNGVGGQLPRRAVAGDRQPLGGRGHRLDVGRADPAATGKAVMAIGGFNGSDDAPTLAQFKAWVAAGDIGYFVVGSRAAGGPVVARTAPRRRSPAGWSGPSRPRRSTGTPVRPELHGRLTSGCRPRAASSPSGALPIRDWADGPREDTTWTHWTAPASSARSSSCARSSASRRLARWPRKGSAWSRCTRTGSPRHRSA